MMHQLKYDVLLQSLLAHFFIFTNSFTFTLLQNRCGCTSRLIRWKSTMHTSLCRICRRKSSRYIWASYRCTTTTRSSSASRTTSVKTSLPTPSRTSSPRSSRLCLLKTVSPFPLTFRISWCEIKCLSTNPHTR